MGKTRVAILHAHDMMLKATDTEEAPWHIVRSDDKRRARLNCIAQLLDIISYKQVLGYRSPRRESEAPQAIGQRSL